MTTFERRRVLAGFTQLLALLSFFIIAGAVAEAASTPAGTTIPNQASATFVDPAVPGTPITVSSNIVTVTVGEVAGITNTPFAIGAVGGGVIVPGGQVNFDFLITNTGNSTNAFSIPNTATFTGTAGATISGPVQISYDGGATWVPLATAAGTFSGSGASGRLQTTPIAVNGTVRVRVVAQIPAGATQNSTVNVVLGNTGANDNSAATQNQAYNAGHTGNVNTTNGPAEPAPGPPLNGMREASAMATTTVAARPQAFASLLKSGAILVGNINPQLATVQYGLTLNVLASYPSAGPAYIASPLVATAMQLNGATAQRVLVSDVIPTQTVLTSVAAPPSGWQVVYSTDVTSVANVAPFTTTAPPDLTTVKRLGWIETAAIPLGASIAGFNYIVTASGVPAGTASTLLNIAQVFGQSQGDLTNLLVYDQSGDQLPSQFSTGTGVAGSSVPLGTTPTSGVAPPAGPNDPGGNTGVQGGDNNVVPLAPQTALLNGPSGVPAALGPDGTTVSDVTIQSVTVPSGLAPASGLPASLQSQFTNTVGNQGTVALTNVTLVPQTPSVPSALPDGTVVAMSWPGQPAPVFYTYTAAGGFVLSSGTPISIPTIPANGGVQSYTVVITLPAGTAQSTNGNAAANGFPVPILASSTTAFGTSSNLTTDTVFTGFLKLTKLAQVFNADGTPCDLTPTAAPDPSCVVTGNFVVYTITYTNIAPVVTGGSVSPSALRVTITEDGQAAPNTFATLFSGITATSHVKGSAIDSTATNTITYFNAANQNVGDIVGTGTATGDVTKYINTFAAPLAPSKTGTFTFKRKIN